MPIYCFQCRSCGEAAQVYRRSVRAATGRDCERCGAAMARDYAAEFAPRPAASAGEIRSEAAGVMPEQAAATERALRRRGVEGVRFDRATGEAVFAGRGERLKALTAMGLHDKNEYRGGR
jgi:hypothetical protein